MNDQANPVSRPWRRFLRFSVRGLVVLALVIGGWLGWIARSARIQREAVAAIVKAGGTVSYDWEWTNGKSIAEGKPWAPRWLVDLIGVDYFAHVTYVALISAAMEADTAMAHIGRLTRLQHLNLAHSPVRDAGLANLEALRCLSYLNLAETQVTDAGMKHLRRMTSLTGLGLGHTRVTDAGLAHLSGLTNLSALGLNETQVTDAGLLHLHAMKSLSLLNLMSTQFKFRTFGDGWPLVRLCVIGGPFAVWQPGNRRRS